MKRYAALGLSALSLAVTPCATAQAPVSDGFAKAVANDSTSPSYVLVAIVNDKSKTRQVVCTKGTYLIEALRLQYHFPITDVGWRKAVGMALANKARTFHFSNVQALAFVRPRYSPQILAEVQAKLKRVSTPELVRGIVNGSLRQVYEKSKDFDAYREALAYVLLERGLQPFMGDRNGALYLAWRPRP